MTLLEITFPANALLMIFMPFVLFIILTRRFNSGWRLILIGMASFILSQAGHIPFNIFLTWLFKKEILPAPPAQYTLMFNAIILGLSAGLWEEIVRWGIYKWWATDARTWRKGILLGAGHGGIESILFGLLALYTYVQLMVLRQVDLVSMLPMEQIASVEQQIQLYWSTPVHLSMMGALERIFAITMQIALSVIVLQVFTRRQIRWLWLAVGLHALIDVVAVYSLSTWGPVNTEIIIAILALGCLGLIFILRQPEPVEELPESKSLVTPVLKLEEIPEIADSIEEIEKTRYQ